MHAFDSTDDLRVTIAGGGRVGLRATRVLTDLGHDVVVIDHDADRVSTISDQTRATVIEGDATHPETLRQADLNRSDTVAALTGAAATNIAICSTSKHLATGIRTLARISSQADLDGVEKIVDQAVFPERAGAKAAVNEILTNRTRSLEDVVGDLDILDVQVSPSAPAANKELNELDLPEGSHVIADAKGRQVARSETTLYPRERYLVAAEPDVVDDVRRLLTG